MRRLAAIALTAIALAGCGDSGGTSDPVAPGREAEEATGFDSDRAFEDLRAQVEIGPRPSGSKAAHETAEFIATRMREAGLDEVAIQTPWENVIGTIPGTVPGTVIVGAHYDTKDIPGFVGANDGASGVAVLLELARSLPAQLGGPSVQLVTFDAEEARGDRDFDRDGTRGSRQYVDYARNGGEQGSAPLTEIKAMVLFDLVGDCDLQLPYEQNSDKDLYALFAVTAAEVLGDAGPFRFNTFPVGDDHEPFLEAGIPAVDFIDFTYGPGAPPGEYWHTTEDTIDKVCPASLETVGETALSAIPKIR
jgi:Zn-dependent M28 family amino/carboxypeptidase